MNVSNLILTSGMEDTWYKTTMLKSKGDIVAWKYNCNGCGHCRDLQTALTTDPIEL